MTRDAAAPWRRRSPPAGWEGFFFIGLFPAGADVVWCKVHLFSGGLSATRHCLAALEGLDGAPQELLLVGRRDVERSERGIERTGGAIASSDIGDTGGAHARGRDVGFEVAGDGAALVTAPGFEARLRLHDGAPLSWIRAPRLLTYFSATGDARVRVGGEALEGFGLLEHAWGAQTRLDVARLAPRRWHWDVLWLGGARFFAALTLHGAGFHGGARLAEGEALVRVRRASVSVRERAPGGAPRRWSGAMATQRGTLRYEARATTSMAPEVTGGGFLGFAWEGELDGARCSGSGFCEQRGGGAAEPGDADGRTR